MSFFDKKDFFIDKLQSLSEKCLLRQIKDKEGIIKNSSRIVLDGKEYINFSSNDYLGLSNNQMLILMAKKAIEKYGVGATASRLLSGGSILHKELEKALSDFKNTESALILNSGYIANSAISVIAEEGDIIFSDEFNHASLIDGCRLSKAKRIIYKHCDMNHLWNLIKKEHGRKKIIVTDSVFSMDGDIAPLKDIYKICQELDDNVILYIDDAHGTGVLGSGKGALAHFNINPEPWIIQMVTFSKALGSYGAAIASDKIIVDYLINSMRGFIFSTALPSHIVAVTLKALELIQKDNNLIKRLWHNRDKAIKGIRNIGIETLNSESPIIPIVIGDINDTLRLSKYLFDNRIYAPAIRPPTVKTPRIRVTVTASHSEDDIDMLIYLLANFTK
jgi:8-amino-7-oxononanoate synthase